LRKEDDIERNIGERSKRSVPSLANFSSKQLRRKRKKIIRLKEPMRGERSQGVLINIKGARSKE